MVIKLSAQTFVLVVPTLNEAGNIDNVLSQVTVALLSTPFNYEIIVVDDGSTDGTAEKVRGWNQRDPRVRVLSRSGEKGLAGAVLYGWGQSRADLLGVMDADLQHPPDVLPRLLEQVEQADIAIASRYAHDHGTDGWNPIRVVLSRLSTLAVGPLISQKHIRVTDPMSGFFIVRRRCIEGLTFQTTGFKLLVEILVRGHIRTVREVPYHFGLRQAGKSKAGAAVAFHYLRLLSRLSRDLVLRSSAQ